MYTVSLTVSEGGSATYTVPTIEEVESWSFTANTVSGSAVAGQDFPSQSFSGSGTGTASITIATNDDDVPECTEVFTVTGTGTVTTFEGFESDGTPIYETSSGSGTIIVTIKDNDSNEYNQQIEGLNESLDRNIAKQDVLNEANADLQREKEEILSDIAELQDDFEALQTAAWISAGGSLISAGITLAGTLSTGALAAEYAIGSSALFTITAGTYQMGDAIIDGNAGQAIGNWATRYTDLASGIVGDFSTAWSVFNTGYQSFVELPDLVSDFSEFTANLDDLNRAIDENNAYVKDLKEHAATIRDQIGDLQDELPACQQSSLSQRIENAAVVSVNTDAAHLKLSNNANTDFQSINTINEYVDQVNNLVNITSSIIDEYESNGANKYFLSSRDSEVFVGSGGIDTVVYDGDIGQYDIQRQGSAATVSELELFGPIAIDRLNSIERLLFNDGSIIMGGSQSESLQGTHLDDTFFQSSGNDLFFGQDGSDTAVFNTASINADIVVSGLNASVTIGNQVTTFREIEFLRFNDQTLDLRNGANSSATEVYRFFNENTGAHFYTASVEERDSIIDLLPNFIFEGNSFGSDASSSADGLPVYRFYNSETGFHFYTASAEEAANVRETLPTFIDEGVAYFANATSEAGGTELFRFFNTSNGSHFYTTSAAERDNIIETLGNYVYEGVAYYVDFA